MEKYILPFSVALNFIFLNHFITPILRLLKVSQVFITLFLKREWHYLNKTGLDTTIGIHHKLGLDLFN